MKSSKTEGLKEVHNILNNEYERMAALSETLEQTSQNFRRINETYDNYGSVFGIASRLVKEIKRRVTLQDLVFYICFYIFLATSAWLFLKRFGLDYILHWLSELFTSLLNYLTTSEELSDL